MYDGIENRNDPTIAVKMFLPLYQTLNIREVVIFPLDVQKFDKLAKEDSYNKF